MSSPPCPDQFWRSSNGKRALFPGIKQPESDADHSQLHPVTGLRIRADQLPQKLGCLINPLNAELNPICHLLYYEEI
jgi:hypothetical protein